MKSLLYSPQIPMQINELMEGIKEEGKEGRPFNRWVSE